MGLKGGDRGVVSIFATAPDSPPHYGSVGAKAIEIGINVVRQSVRSDNNKDLVKSAPGHGLFHF